MIFVTVGTQLPFDRLIRAMDEWAAKHPDQEVIAQTAGGDYKPQHMKSEAFIDPGRYRDLTEQCSQMVAHAGTGSILSAQEHGKPLLILPRSPELKEVRSDHQHATCEKYSGRSRILIARETAELDSSLEALLQLPPDSREEGADGDQAAALHGALREFVAQARGRVKDAPCKRVVCACSTGGHFVEMLHMLSCLQGDELIIMTSDAKDALSLPASRHFTMREASRWSRSKGLSTLIQLFFLMPRLRPDVVLSTGAAPGLVAAMVGRLTGARVVWIDSLANVDRISLAGRIAKIFTHLFLVQWPELADGRRTQFVGRVR